MKIERKVTFISSRRHPALAAIDPVPSVLREPALVVGGHADHQEEIVLVDVRREAIPNTAGAKRGIDEPGRPEEVPPLATALDCVVQCFIISDLGASGHS